MINAVAIASAPINATGAVSRSAIASAASPLGPPSAFVAGGFVGALDSAGSAVYYVCDLVSGGQSARLPMSSWQATIQIGRASFVQAVIPAVDSDTLNEISQYSPNGEIVISRGTRIGGVPVEIELARAALEQIRYDRGPYRTTVTLAGYSTLEFYANPLGRPGWPFGGVPSSWTQDPANKWTFDAATSSLKWSHSFTGNGQYEQALLISPVVIMSSDAPITYEFEIETSGASAWLDAVLIEEGSLDTTLFSHSGASAFSAVSGTVPEGTWRLGFYADASGNIGDTISVRVRNVQVSIDNIRTLTDIQSVSLQSGLRVRSRIDWFLRPGMVAVSDQSAFPVSYINYYVGAGMEYMDVGERA